MKQKQRIILLLLGFALLSTIAVYASDDCRGEIRLTATEAGAAIAAEGRAELRSQDQGREQRFKVEVRARVDDGTTFAVLANGEFVGTITMRGFEGELRFDNEEGPLPPAIDPVCCVSTVDVVDGDHTVILHGEF